MNNINNLGGGLGNYNNNRGGGNKNAAMKKKYIWTVSYMT